MEEIIMQLIANGGDARSRAMEAISSAKSGDVRRAKELIQEATEAIDRAHDFQTKLIQDEAKGNKTEISLLMVHAQDHFMCAMVIRDLAYELVEMYERLMK